MATALPKTKSAATVPFRAGLRCLDFLNTVDWRTSASPEELLPDYDALVIWSLRAKTITPPEAEAFLARAQKNPLEAQNALQKALIFREGAFALVDALRTGTAPVLEALERFHATLADVLPRLRIDVAGPSWQWGWDQDPEALDRPFWPLVREMAEILVSEERFRIKQCATPGCGWVFWDTSKNHSRRWCSMEGCGNRAKGRRFSARKRDGGAKDPGTTALP